MAAMTSEARWALITHQRGHPALASLVKDSKSKNHIDINMVSEQRDWNIE